MSADRAETATAVTSAAAAPAAHDDAAAAILAAHAPQFASAAADVTFLGVPDPRKNHVVAFSRRGEGFVLKVFRDSLRYALHTLTAPVLRRVAGCYALRARAVARADNSVRAADAFARAGFATPRIAARPSPVALVFERVDAPNGRVWAEDGRSVAEIADLVRAMAGDAARRQEAAIRSGDRHLLLPAPRINHVLVGRDGGRTYIDFEAIVNPGVPVERLTALEAETFLANLARSRLTNDPAVLRAALDGLGDAAVARWRALVPGPLDALSGSARRRRERLSRAAAALAAR